MCSLPSGHSFGVLESGQSKFARRGQHDLMFYCTMEMYLAMFQAHDPAINPKTGRSEEEFQKKIYRTRFANRLMVACLEDLTPSCPEIIPLLPGVYRAIVDSYAGPRPSPEVVSMLHELGRRVAEAPKSRLLQEERLVGFRDFRKLRALIDDERRMPLKGSWRAALGEFEALSLSGRPEWLSGVMSAARRLADIDARFSHQEFALSAGFCVWKHANLINWRAPRAEPIVADAERGRALLDAHMSAPRRALGEYPFVFDKHVAPVFRKEERVDPCAACPRGWRGFIEHELRACADREPPILKEAPGRASLQEAYLERRLAEDAERTLDRKRKR